jgi:translation elongation factor EF-Ts
MLNRDYCSVMIQFIEENCLLDQKYIFEDSMPVKSAVAQLLPNLRISGFIRMECGEES